MIKSFIRLPERFQTLSTLSAWSFFVSICRDDIRYISIISLYFLIRLPKIGHKILRKETNNIEYEMNNDLSYGGIL